MITMPESMERHLTVEERLRYGLPIDDPTAIDEEIERQVEARIEWSMTADADSARRYGFTEAVCNMVEGMLDAMGLDDDYDDLWDLRAEMEASDYAP